MSVEIPVVENGKFDLIAQKKIAAKHKEIDAAREHAENMLRQIAGARIAFG